MLKVNQIFGFILQCSNAIELNYYYLKVLLNQLNLVDLNFKIIR